MLEYSNFIINLKFLLKFFKVSEDELVAEIETDKTSVEVPAPQVKI